MLNRFADQIMTTRVPTSVVQGGNQAAMTMPSPRATAGGVPPFGLMGYVEAPSYSGVGDLMETLKKPAVLGLLAGAAFLFFTSPGKSIRRKLGLG
jgi:hypothetical protein